MHKPYGFELIKDHPDWKVFKTSCECLHPEHDCTVELEHDKEFKMLIMTLSSKTNLTEQYYWYEHSFFKRWWMKLKTCTKVIFNKPLQFESSLIFRGRNHIEDFADFISLLAKDVEQESSELEHLRKEVKRLKNK